jgi:cathepsin F
MEVEGPKDNSAWVYLNGELIFGPGDFHGSLLSADVDLWESDTLRVKLAGKPGSALTVTVFGARVGYAHAGDYDDFIMLPASGPMPNVEIDWRTHGVVTGVKDSAELMAEWAFSATGVAEGARAVAAGTLLSFAEQPLIDCGAWGEDGSPALGLNYLRANGAVLESVYPYTAEVGECWDYSAFALPGPTQLLRVPPGDEDTLFAALLEYGPISVVMRVGAVVWFQLYGGGVVTNPPVCDQDWTTPVAMLIVGLHNGAWIIKNSWGAGWGEGGYFELARGYNSCGIADYAATAVY